MSEGGRCWVGCAELGVSCAHKADVSLHSHHMCLFVCAALLSLYCLCRTGLTALLLMLSASARHWCHWTTQGASGAYWASRLGVSAHSLTSPWHLKVWWCGGCCVGVCVCCTLHAGRVLINWLLGCLPAPSPLSSIKQHLFPALTHSLHTSPPSTPPATKQQTGLTEVLTTGGIPPAVSEPCSADRVYAALYKRVLTQNKHYYARFPQDVEVVGRIVSFLAAQPGGGLELPSGSRLTPRAFQLLGLSGLGSGGACLSVGVYACWMRGKSQHCVRA